MFEAWYYSRKALAALSWGSKLGSPDDIYCKPISIQVFTFVYFPKPRIGFEVNPNQSEDTNHFF